MNNLSLITLCIHCRRFGIILLKGAVFEARVHFTIGEHTLRHKESSFITHAFFDAILRKTSEVNNI